MKKARTRSGRASTSRRNNERSNDRDQFLASLINNMLDAMIVTDLQYIILEWNAAAENMYGWKAAEVLGKPLDNFVQTDMQSMDADEAARAVMELGTWSGEVTQMRKDGTRLPIWSLVSVLRDKNGEPTGLLGINRDISARKRAEVQLHQSEECFSKAFHSTPTALALSRLSDSKFEYVNESFLKLVDYQLDEVIGKSPYEISLSPTRPNS